MPLIRAALSVLAGVLAMPIAASAQLQPAVDLTAVGGQSAAGRTASGPIAVLFDPAHAPPRLRVVTVTDRRSLLYVTDQGAREVLDESEVMRTLPWLYRQEPSNSGTGAALAGNGQRVSKASGAALASAASSAEIAHMLRRAVDASCTTPAGVSTCAAHRVTVDEITPRFGGVGRRSAAAIRLGEAMAHLSHVPAPWGGTYARRVDFLVAPAVSTSVTDGLGPARTLGRDGRVHRRDYRDAFAAMARGGGVWLEMYHYTASHRFTPFTMDEWRNVPLGVASFLGAVSPYRNPLDYLHAMFASTTGTGSAPGPPCSTPGIPSGPTVAGMPACPAQPDPCQAVPWLMPNAFPDYGGTLLWRRARIDRAMVRRAGLSMAPLGPTAPPLVIQRPGSSPMQCQWLRAQTGSVNQRVLANGAGAFRVAGAQAITWGRLLRQAALVP